ncbi:MAG: BON domain-containing protein [Anaerolineales bacterium]|nr:BON domain-containing protein [Anaerolineales bacterium]
MNTHRLSDHAIKADILAHLEWDDRIDITNIEVSIKDGDVTLSGIVPTYAAREAAKDLAWSVEGVRSVIDKMEIAPSAGADLPTDLEVQSILEDILDWDPEVDANDIELSVVDGWVTLRGSVDTYWKKLRTEERLSTLRGVKGMTNELAVVLTRSITDKVIAEGIVDAIDRDIRVNVNNVTVVVNQGVVRLSGIVATLRARAAAENAARYTAGVADVENEIVVREAI